MCNIKRTNLSCEAMGLASTQWKGSQSRIQGLGFRASGFRVGPIAKSRCGMVGGIAIESRAKFCQFEFNAAPCRACTTMAMLRQQLDSWAWMLQ